MLRPFLVAVKAAAAAGQLISKEGLNGCDVVDNPDTEF